MRIMADLMGVRIGGTVIGIATTGKQVRFQKITRRQKKSPE
jgi:hypothetical protein